MAHDATVNERTKELTWALIDNQLSDDEFRLLDTLLLSDDGARDTYVNCVKLHSDLMFHFADAAQQPASGNLPPVLGFLSEGLPAADAQAAPQ